MKGFPKEDIILELHCPPPCVPRIACECLLSAAVAVIPLDPKKFLSWVSANGQLQILQMSVTSQNRVGIDMPNITSGESSVIPISAKMEESYAC